MEDKVFEIIWSKRADRQLQKLFEYIAEDSFKNAEKVVDDIELKVESLKRNPERYAPDKFKVVNPDLAYRCFTKHHYRVSCRIGKSSIKVIRIRHTKMKPGFY